MSSIRRLWLAAAFATLCLSSLPANTISAKEQPPLAPTFTVFATREGLVGHRTANGHRIQSRDHFVALPFTGVLSSKDGNEFQVRVTYRDRSVVLPVWDIGPWNTRDDYWSPERRYSDLPVGKPMAQAAYQDGYNHGRDEAGRRVRTPNGIDIADGAFWDDLGMTNADWVEVSFLWLGSDAGAPSSAEAAPVPQAANIEPNAVMVDNDGNGYNAQATVTWYDAACGINNHHAWTYSTPDPQQSENQARWNLTLLNTGFYEAFAYIPACGKPATQSAHYRIYHDGTNQTAVVDQAAAAGNWASLGIYHVNDPTVAVELSDITRDDARGVRFDAVKWIPRTDSTAPEASVTSAQHQADGSFLISWHGTDDVSGVAQYDLQIRALPDGGWSDWRMGTTVLQANFMPPATGDYAFRARARDWLGNQQAWRDTADLTIQVK